ncbi:MAG: hypothetical protein GXO66_06655 [Euryarchaeota archaeon]|nr:hypothetical protein [Euryarchaeota archaeon]
MSEELRSRVERALETLGYAVALTFFQLLAVYLLVSLKLFGKYNVFRAFREFFETYLFFLDRLYFLVVNLLYGVFGPSYPHVPGFNNVFKLVFFIIFLTNLGLFAYLRRREK